jgi:2Fe-2S ferredoxin
MPRITFTGGDGAEQTVEAREGETLMAVAVRHDVAGIEGECGGVLSCGTCHVHVDPAWVDRLPAASDDETDMLEVADDVCERSRLCCQIRATREVDGLQLRVPA